MFDRVLRQMREAIRACQYVMTLHAEEEMSDDGLSVFDIEYGVLTGLIAERQRDSAASEWKYLVRGQTLGGEPIVIVARLGATGKLVIITVFRA